MFSGIRSLLFNVYTDQEVEEDSQQQTTGKDVNAAVPLQSIEQLQSSSHQILPTLEEQHEEDELKRIKQLEASEASKEKDEDEEDDDGCFNADSWELLDLVEPEKKSQQQEQPDLNRKQEPAEINATTEPEEPAKQQDDTFEEKERELATPPTLNYAAALAKQLGNKTTEESNKLDKNKKKNKKEEAANKKATIEGRALKRNRPLSSSSWSSNDHDDELEKAALEVRSDSPAANEPQPVVNRANVDNDDNDSIISSGFSDCDFGYGAVNDFVMRPKKAQGSRRRRASHSSSVVATPQQTHTVAKDALETSKVTSTNEGQKHNKQKPTAQGTDNSNKRSTNQASWKHIKPKKKKIILSAPSGTCSDFLKKRNAVANSPTANKLELPAVSSSRSSTNSSELADMDDSWYVTPPPCFTRANLHNSSVEQQQQPKAILSNRENALIEHPSIYIASTSKQQQQQKLKQQQQQKLVNKQESSNSSVTMTTREQQKPKQQKSPSPPSKKVAAKKAWENKFIVSNWGYEIDQDDINDFDNLFYDEHECPAKPSSVKRSAKKQQQKKVDQVESTDASPSLGDECDSDWSLSRSPALVGVTPEVTKSDEEARTAPSPSPEVELAEFEDEEEKNRSISVASSSAAEEATPEVKKKAPVLVRPIGPERQPGWQLRRKRQRRRPLSTVSLQATNLVARSPVAPRLLQRQSQLKERSLPSPKAASSASASSASSSARMSPTLMDRIQSSIVANLTNLTGFQAIARQAIEETQQQQQQLDRQVQQQTLAKKLQVSEANSAAMLERRRLTKSHLERQNRSVQVASSARRADRRLKMHTKPNGYSVNRKVQTAFH